MTDMRPLQSPTADEIARIRAALPTGAPSMKGKWESMETAPRDGRPGWCRTAIGLNWVFWSDTSTYGNPPWVIPGRGPVTAKEWFNPEAAP